MVERTSDERAAPRAPTVDPRRLRHAVGAGILALAGCSREPSPTPAASSAPVARPPAPPASAVALPVAVGSAAGTTRGVAAGVRYLEHMTGGARPDERVPMIVVLHPMGGDPADLLETFQRYPRRARLILPYGHPSGGMYVWYPSVDVAEPVVTREADRIARALDALVAGRPTLGKPLVTGFSQGGIMTFVLAVTHPEVMAAAFPISGSLPPSMVQSIANPSRPRPARPPPVAAFHGAADRAVPTQDARDAIAELRRAGYPAELHEYVGVEHDMSAEEEREILGRIGRAADGLEGATPGP